MKIISEGPIKITKSTIESAWKRREKGHRLIIRDKVSRGLALIVNATSMTWTYAYRPRGRDPVTKRRWPNKAVTIGNPSSHSVEDARIEANHIKGRAASGADPAAERRAAAEEANRRRGTTLERVLETYQRVIPKRTKLRGTGLPSPAYVTEELSQIKLVLAEMDATQKPIAELTEVDVRKVLAGGGVARKRFGALSRFLDWCQDAGYIQANPCLQIARSRRPKAPQARAHYLTSKQLARLWRAAEALREPVWRDIARFLIAVPCRRNEAARMEWQHVDLDAAEWRQPGHLTKNRDAHRLHLHPLALDVLAKRREATGGKGLVFPAPKSGEAVDTFTNVKAELTRATAQKKREKDAPPALTGWTWHDFRRSFATALGEAGVSETVADAVLNHRQSATRGGVLGAYQRASRWPEQQQAMQLWGRLLADAIEGREADANVVPIATRKVALTHSR